MQGFVISSVALVWAALARPYHSGEVKTHERYLYGRFRTRMQGSGMKGTCASLFTFWESVWPEPFNVADWNEIDIELVPSVEATPFFTNIIYSGR